MLRPIKLTWSRIDFQEEVDFTVEMLDQLRNPLLRNAVRFIPSNLRRRLAGFLVKLHGRTETVQCDTTTISELIKSYELPRIDLLKMDIEGGEVDALRGIAEQDWCKIQQLCVETHFGDELHQQVWQLLKQKGYELSEQDNPVAQSDRLIYAIRPADDDALV